MAVTGFADLAWEWARALGAFSGAMFGYIGVCWTLTIWTRGICIENCSPGTWSLVSFGRSLSLVTTLRCLGKILLQTHPVYFPLSTSAHPSSTSPGSDPRICLGLSEIPLVLPFISALCACKRWSLCVYCFCSAHEFNYISASTHSGFDISQRRPLALFAFLRGVCAATHSLTLYHSSRLLSSNRLLHACRRSHSFLPYHRMLRSCWLLNHYTCLLLLMQTC